MAADLKGVDEKIKWANKHLDDLKARIAKFEDTGPYDLIIKDDPQDTKRRDGFLEVKRPIPTSIALTTVDAVHNPRSALDHLACAAVGNTVTQDTAFPIWRNASIPSAQQYKSLVIGKVKGAPEPFINLLLGLQPYAGGNHEALWAVDYLDITDKHRLLIEALASIERFHQHVGPFTLVLRPTDDRFPLKDGDLLFSGFKDQQNPQVEIDIALAEPPPLHGEPVVPALTQLVKMTTAVIDQLRRVL